MLITGESEKQKTIVDPTEKENIINIQSKQYFRKAPATLLCNYINCLFVKIDIYGSGTEVMLNKKQCKK